MGFSFLKQVCPETSSDFVVCISRSEHVVSPVAQSPAIQRTEGPVS